VAAVSGTRGLLLFGVRPQGFFPNAQVRLARFKDGQILNDHAASGDLFAQLDGAMDWLRNRLEVRFDTTPRDLSLEGMQRREIWEYPLEALREAILNALVHRDYTALGDIQIRLYDDRIEAWSPGRLPEGISIDQLRIEGHGSVLRNPLIAATFYFASFIERWGSGTTLMIAACRAHGLPEPEISETFGGVRVIFRKDMYSIERLRAMGLNERQVEAVIFVKREGSIGNTEFQELAGVSKRTASRDLDALVETGVLERLGVTGRATRYTFKGSQTGQRGHEGARNTSNGQ
jgi:ATP-dependent DNA helicase RecG